MQNGAAAMANISNSLKIDYAQNDDATPLMTEIQKIEIKDAHRHFRAALFTTATRWGPKCPTKGKWIDKHGLAMQWNSMQSSKGNF